MRLTHSISVFAAILPLVQAGMYGQPVLNLDAKTFKTVMATEHAAMVAFVAPWCGHCKNLGPEYTAAASSLSPLIPFYAVDCDDASNKPLCAEYQIKGFPTIKSFPRAGKGPARDYNGERKRGPLIEYAKTLVPDRVKKLRVEANKAVEPVIQSFLQDKSELPHVLLVHPSAPSIPFLWKVLAHRLSGKAHLAFIKDTTSHSVLSSLNLDASDTTRDATRVVAWSSGGQQSDLTEYKGAMKFNALLEWLQDYLGISNSNSNSKQSKNTNTNNEDKKTKQKSNNAKAPEPIKPESTSSSGGGTPGSSGNSDAAARRAKMDEAEKRDKERRERAAAAAAAQAKVGTPVEEPDASPEERADIPSSANAVVSDEETAADPVPQQIPEDDLPIEKQAVHEEL